MFIRRISVLLIAFVISTALTSCSGNYDSETGSYYNKGKGFSINFPKGWKKTKAQMGALVSIVNSDETGQINIVVQDLPQNISLDKYFQTVSAQGNRFGARVKESGDMTIDGTDARWSMVSISVGGKQFTSLNYYAMKGSRVYSIVCIADSEAFPDFEGTFDKVIESFKFI